MSLITASKQTENLEEIGSTHTHTHSKTGQLKKVEIITKQLESKDGTI